MFTGVITPNSKIAPADNERLHIFQIQVLAHIETKSPTDNICFRMLRKDTKLCLRRNKRKLWSVNDIAKVREKIAT